MHLLLSGGCSTPGFWCTDGVFCRVRCRGLWILFPQRLSSCSLHGPQLFREGSSTSKLPKIVVCVQKKVYHRPFVGFFGGAGTLDNAVRKSAESLLAPLDLWPESSKQKLKTDNFEPTCATVERIEILHERKTSAMMVLEYMDDAGYIYIYIYIP